MVKDWRDEFMRLGNFPSARAYVDDLVREGIDLSDTGASDYTAMHAAVHKILQTQKQRGKKYR